MPLSGAAAAAGRRHTRVSALASLGVPPSGVPSGVPSAVTDNGAAVTALAASGNGNGLPAHSVATSV